MRQIAIGLIGSVVIAMGVGCATSADDSQTGTIAPAPSTNGGLYVVMTRPPTVPQHYTATPNGWFDPACVIAVAENEHVTVEGHVVRADGSMRRAARPCPSPRYDVQGRVVVDSTNAHAGELADLPTTNGWIEYIHSTALGAMSYVHSQWTVPAAPTSNTGQVIYFFPGLENATSVTSILQPVLGYNHSGGPGGVWSLASWNCCVTGTTWHSATYLTVAAGSTVSGDMQGTSCNAGTGVCPNWSIVSRNSAGTTTTLNTTTTQAQNWLFGQVLEAYSIDTCSELPGSSNSVASAFVLRNAAGTTVAAPAWTNTVLSVSPVCSYAASHTTTTATVQWVNSGGSVCTPGDSRACCPFAQGCSCLGDQTCNAGGTAWGACSGAGRAGQPCP